MRLGGQVFNLVPSHSHSALNVKYIELGRDSREECFIFALLTGRCGLCNRRREENSFPKESLHTSCFAKLHPGQQMLRDTGWEHQQVRLANVAKAPHKPALNILQLDSLIQLLTLTKISSHLFVQRSVS